MRNSLLFALMLLFYTTSSTAQIQFQKTIGGPEEDYGSSVQQTTDGGYIVAGNTYFSNGGSGIYLVKTDNFGDTLWTKTIGDSLFVLDKFFNSIDYDTTYIVQQTSLGYVIGEIDAENNGSGFIYLDSIGVLQIIQNSFINDTTLRNFFPQNYTIGTNGVNYAEVGHVDVRNPTRGNIGVFINNGNNMISANYGDNNNDHGNCIQFTNDGGYIIAGTSYHSNGNGDIYLLKLNTLGILQWSKIYGDSTVNEEGIFVQQTIDSGFIILARDYYRGMDSSQILLIKTDFYGDTLWSKIYGGGHDDIGNCVQQTSDGGYIVVGNTWSFGMGGSDVYLFKTDSNGDTLWSKTYGGTGDDYGSSVQQTNDGGYIIVGSTFSFGSGGSDIFLIKTDANGNSGCNETNPSTLVTLKGRPVSNPATSTGSTGTSTAGGDSLVFFLSWNDSTNDIQNCLVDGLKETTYSNSILVYPNPCDGNFNLQLTDNNFENAKLNIYNSIGQNIYHSVIKNNYNGFVQQIHLNASAGIYLIKINDREMQYTQKLIIE